MQEALQYFLFLVVGILAGIVNTLAGGASVFILSTLLFFGVPANIANGTNRLGIFVQNLAGTITFQKSGLLDIPSSLIYVIPAIIGAIVGAWIATDISQQSLEYIMAGVMAITLYPILKKPNSSAKANFLSKKKSTVLTILLFFAIGFYGGFIQAGIGLLIIVALSKVVNLSIIRSNAIKMLIILIYTLPVFIIFIYNDLVDWPIAIWLAVGQVIGTSLAAKFFVKHPKANIWVKWLLVSMIVIAIVKIINWLFIWDFFMSYVS